MFAVLLSFLGCSQDTDTLDPLGTYDATRADLAELTTRHGAAIAVVDDLGTLMDEEDGYLQDCRSDQDQLETCVQQMDGCSTRMGGGMMGDDWAGDADQASSDWWDAMQAHHEAMGACTDAGCCHDEEDRWQDEAAGMLDHMGEVSTEFPDGGC